MMEIELAIFEDCSGLINKFENRSNPSFTTFSQQWRNEKFHYIYGVQTTVVEVIQTTKAILHFAKRIACPNSMCGKLTNVNNNVVRRIGGIYLMYAIYFKQPTNRFVKLLMSNETWQELTTFIQNLPVNNINDEVRYIFWHLYREDAFHFTGSDYDLGLESMADYDRLYGVYNGNNCVDIARENLKHKLIIVKETKQTLSIIISLEDQYNITKKSLPNIDKLEKSLPQTKIFHGIYDATQSIHDILDDKGCEDNLMRTNNMFNNNHKRELKRKIVGNVSKDDKLAEKKFQELKLREHHWSVRKMIDQQLPEAIKADLIHNSADEE